LSGFWTFGFHKRRRISGTAQRLSVLWIQVIRQNVTLQQIKVHTRHSNKLIETVKSIL